MIIAIIVSWDPSMHLNSHVQVFSKTLFCYKTSLFVASGLTNSAFVAEFAFILVSANYTNYEKLQPLPDQCQ